MNLLTSGVITAYEAQAMENRIQRAHHSLYGTDKGLTTILGEELAPGEYDKFMALLNRNNARNIEAAGELLAKWKKHIGQLPQLTITLSFTPSRSFVKQVQEIFYNAGFNAAKLKLKTDPTIMGGVIIAWKGQLFDRSLQNEWRQAVGTRSYENAGKIF